MRRVVKVGGSLLDWPLLSERLCRWLARQTPAENWLVAGGGSLCDAVRQWDALHGLGEASSHRLCLEALGVTAALLETVLADGWKCLAPGDTPPDVRVVDLRRYQAECPLPHTWQVTSDSLAAHLALFSGAEELVLLKSANLLGAMTRAAAAQCGYVDEYFPRVAADVARVRAVNLRDEGFSQWWLDG
jgi:aspartokinase-like uncharacterized kinase